MTTIESIKIHTCNCYIQVTLCITRNAVTTAWMGMILALVTIMIVRLGQIGVITFPAPHLADLVSPLGCERASTTS